MFSMVLGLFGSNSVTSLLGDSTFWYGLVLIAGLIIAVVFSIKYWNRGGKFALLALVILANCAFSVHSIIQLNMYYSARGGIHGVLDGIFKTNELEVVDNLSFSLTNIELTEESEGYYSAKIITDEVLDLEKGIEYTVYVNESPCAYVDTASDYVVADYKYVFLDNDKSEILTDTLSLRFAFYDNSTSLSVATSGGAEAAKYWQHYFRKNNFVVSIEPSTYVKDEVLDETTGDISNCVYVTYVAEDEFYCKQVYTIGSVITLPEISGSYTSWKINGVEVGADYVITEDVTITCDYIYDFNVTLMADNAEYSTVNVTTDYLLESYFPSVLEYSAHKYYVKGWSLDGETELDFSTYVVSEDLTLYPIIDYVEYRVRLQIASETVTQWVREGYYVDEPELPEGYDLDYWLVDTSTKVYDLSTYPITTYKTFTAHGTYLQTVYLYNGDELYKTLSVNYGETLNLSEITIEGTNFFGWSSSASKVVITNTKVIKGETSFYAVYGEEGDILLTLTKSDFVFKLTYDEVTLNSGTNFTSQTLITSDEIDLVLLQSKYGDSLADCEWEINVTADGEYSISELATGTYTIKFTNCTFVSISIDMIY